MDAAQIQTTSQQIATFATGIFAAMILLVNWFSLWLANWWTGKLYPPSNVSEQFSTLRLSRSAGLVGLFVIVLAAVWHDQALLDVLPVVMLPLVLAALSMVHVLLAGKKWSAAVLAAMYGSLLIMTPFAIMLLAGIGFVDSWFDFRRQHSNFSVKNEG